MLKFDQCPGFDGDNFTLVASICAPKCVSGPAGFIDLMCWGNNTAAVIDEGANDNGQRTREFGLRNGFLEYGQWDGSNWEAVRAGVPIDDGRWHRVAVIKKMKDVSLYVDGHFIGRREITSTISNDQVDPCLYCARFRSLEKVTHDYFFMGAIKKTLIYKKAMKMQNIFQSVS